MKLVLAAVIGLLPATATAAEVPEAAAEVAKGVKAYNAKDLAYYEAALAEDAVYIAEDGGLIAGRERVVALFKRIFAKTPGREVAVSDVTTGGRGEVAWARFRWTLTAGEEVRKGIATTLFVRGGSGFQVLQIQNTPDGHAAAHH